MPILLRSWVPSASVVPQERGPDYLAPIDGADWSDGNGCYRGFFSAFRVRAGKEVWFHFPIPTLVEHEGRMHFLHGVSLLWEVADGAELSWIIVQHGGMERVQVSARAELPPSDPAPFEPPELWRSYYPDSNRRLTSLELSAPIKLEFGVQLCVLVTAAQTDGLVRFYGAGIDLCDGC